MALGDFIHEQASSKIQDMRDRKHAEEDREYERQAQLEDEFRGKQQAVAEELQVEINEAMQKADEILAMPMPEDYQEFTKMVRECGLNSDKPIKESTLAVKLAGYESVNYGELDFKLPSKTVNNAWRTRLDQLLQYGAASFSSNPNYEAFVKPFKTKTASFQKKKKIMLIGGAIGGFILICILCMIFD